MARRFARRSSAKASFIAGLKAASRNRGRRSSYSKRRTWGRRRY